MKQQSKEVVTAMENKKKKKWLNIKICIQKNTGTGKYGTQQFRHI